MAPETVQTAVIVGTFTVLGSIISVAGTYLTMKRQQESASDRIRSKQKLDKKLEILADFNAEMSQLYALLDEYTSKAERDELDFEEFRKTIPVALRDFIANFYKTGVYLGNEERIRMTGVSEVFVKHGEYIRWKIDNPNADEPDVPYTGAMNYDSTEEQEQMEVARAIIRKEVDVASEELNFDSDLPFDNPATSHQGSD